MFNWELVGPNLQTFRKFLGYSAADFAKKTGVSENDILYYESKKKYPTPEYMLNLNNIFNLSTMYPIYFGSETSQENLSSTLERQMPSKK